MLEQARDLVGIDWGSQTHQVCWWDPATGVAVQRAFPHGYAGLARLVGWLRERSAEVQALAVAIEVPHGPVVEALLDAGIAVYAINPKAVDRFRDRHSVAGAKDDRRSRRVPARGQTQITGNTARRSGPSPAASFARAC